MPNRPVPSNRQQQLQNRGPPTTHLSSPAVSEPSPPTLPSRVPSASRQRSFFPDDPALPTQTYEMGKDYPDALKLKALITMMDKPDKWATAADELAKLIPGKSKAQVISFFTPPVGPLKEIQGKNIKGGRNAIISYLIKQHIENELIAAGEDEQKKVEIMSRIYRDIDFDPESIKNFWGSSKPKPRARMKRTKKKMKRTKKRN